MFTLLTSLPSKPALSESVRDSPSSDQVIPIHNVPGELSTGWVIPQGREAALDVIRGIPAFPNRQIPLKPLPDSPGWKKYADDVTAHFAPTSWVDEVIVTIWEIWTKWRGHKLAKHALSHIPKNS